MEYKNTTRRPSVEGQRFRCQVSSGSAKRLQKVAYVAQIMLESEATNHIMLTAQLLLGKGQ